jgi:hypothetical protein
MKLIDAKDWIIIINIINGMKIRKNILKIREEYKRVCSLFNSTNKKDGKKKKRRKK